MDKIPRRVRIGERAVAWRKKEVEEWIRFQEELDLAKEQWHGGRKKLKNG